MIKQMINLDPSARPTFDTLLHTSRGTVYPESFYSFLHNYVSSINELPSPSPFAPTVPSSNTVTATHSVAPSISSNSTHKATATSINANPPSADNASGALPSDSDHRIERIWADYESVEPYIVPEIGDETVMDPRIDYGSSAGSSRPYQVWSHKCAYYVWYLTRAGFLQDILPVELYIPNRDSKLRGALHLGSRAAAEGKSSCIFNPPLMVVVIKFLRWSRLDHTFSRKRQHPELFISKLQSPGFGCLSGIGSSSNR